MLLICFRFENFPYLIYSDFKFLIFGVEMRGDTNPRTRTEVDELQKTLAELKREIRALKRAPAKPRVKPRRKK